MESEGKDKKYYEVKATIRFESEEDRNEFLKQVDFIKAVAGLPNNQTTICQAVCLVDYLYSKDIKQELRILVRNTWGSFTQMLLLPKRI